MFEFIKSLIWNPGTVISGVVVLIVTQVWARYRHRSTTLRWRALHQPLAIATRDAQHGTVEVTYNGSPANNVYVTSLELHNDSSVDHENVQIIFMASDGCGFLSGVGVIKGCADKLIPSAAPVQPAQTNTTNAVLASRTTIGQNRMEFSIPILNRYTTITFMFLTHAVPGRIVNVQLSCLHKGIRTKELRYPQFLPGIIWGESARKATIIGIFVELLVVIWLCFTYPLHWWAFVLVLILGTLTMLYGAVAIKFLKYVNRFIG